MGFSIVLLLSEADEAVKIVVQGASEVKACVNVRCEWDYVLTKNLSYHGITKVSARRCSSMKCQCDWCLLFSFWVLTYIVSIVFLRKKKKKARCMVLCINTCHKTQLLLLLTHFSCHKAHCCSFVWMWKELWFICKHSYTMNKANFCITNPKSIVDHCFHILILAVDLNCDSLGWLR